MQCVDLPLREIPECVSPTDNRPWGAVWSHLMADDWLRKKVDRDRRLVEHWRYVQEWLPELATEPPGVVWDIGPGMGELLEIAWHFGHDAKGIDANTESSEMGHGYATAAKMMHHRQGLRVAYTTHLMFYLGIMRNHPSWPAGKVLAINLRGSIEQALAPLMLGQRHVEHHDCKQLRWDMPRAAEQLDSMMAAFSDLLRPGGVLMIHANGCATEGPGNVHDYDAAVLMSAARAGLEIVKREPPTIHKWRKP